jgi:hypothetical protein
MQWILLAVVIAAGWFYWRRRKARLAHKDSRRQEIEALSGPNYVGLSATVISESLDGKSGRVRLVDPSTGRSKEFEARVDEGDGAVKRGEEVLVIEGGAGDRPLVVVPNELPRLEDLS